MSIDFSVVIPFYNDHQWIDEAVGSVLQQTRPPRQVIIVDDVGPRPLAWQERDWPAMVTVHRMERNSGVGAARNHGVDQARHDVVAFLDADDWWAPTMLEEVGRVFDSNPEVDGTFTGVTIAYSDGSVRSFAEKPELLTFRQAVVPPTSWIPSCLAVCRESLLRFGKWSDDRTIMDDWDLGIRLVGGGGKLVGVSKPLVYWRRFSHGNLSQDHGAMLRKSLRTIRVHRNLISRQLGATMPIRLVGAAFRDRGRKQRGISGRALVALGRLFPRP